MKTFVIWTTLKLNIEQGLQKKKEGFKWPINMKRC